VSSGTFIGFYMGRGFWVGRPLDLFDEKSDDQLRGIIPEIVSTYSHALFDAAACIDGLLLLRVNHLAASVPNMGDPRQFEASTLWWREHLDYANALQLLVESESRKCSDSNDMDSAALSISNTCRVEIRDGFVRSQSFERGRNLLTVRRETLEWISGRRIGDRPAELRDTTWSVVERVSSKAISKAMARFASTVHDSDRIKLLSTIVQAKTAHAEGHFSTAFILFWFAIESSVRSIIQNLNKTPKNSPIITAIEKLLELGEIDQDLANELQELRVIRNKLAHAPGSTICTPTQSGRAANAAVAMSAHRSELQLTIGWNTSVQF